MTELETLPGPCRARQEFLPTSPSAEERDNRLAERETMLVKWLAIAVFATIVWFVVWFVVWFIYSLSQLDLSVGP